MVIIPQAVYQEIENGKEKPYYCDLSKMEWISIQQITNTDSLDYFFDLDKGEAEVLILARELKADLVILDESLGRRYAKQLDLTLTGTIGILLKAKEKGLIPFVKESILELTTKGCWLSNNLIASALKIAGE